MEENNQNSGLRVIYIGDLNCYTRSAWRLHAVKKYAGTTYEINSTQISQDKSIYKYSFIEKINIKLRLKHDRTGFNKKLLEINPANYDLVWVDGCLDLKNETIKKLRYKNKNLLFLYFSEDDFLQKHNNKINFLSHLKLYDFVVTTKKRNIKRLNQELKQCLLVNDSYSDYLYKKIEKTIPNIFEGNNYEYEVSFIGAYESERSESLLFLAKNNIKVHVWGNGWGRLLNKHENLKIQNTHLQAEEYLKVICKSKVNLNFLRKLNNDQITSRSIEIPSCGGFMIAEFTKEHAELFNKEEVVLFSDDEDLLYKVRHYLENDQDRDKKRFEAQIKVNVDEFKIEGIVKKLIMKIKKT